MMMMENCLFCEYHQLDPKGNPGTTSNSLKTLFQFLNVNVGRRRRSSTASSSVSVFVEEAEEEEVGWIASKICEDCAIVANEFGTMAESFEQLLQNFLKQWIRKLVSRSNNNKSLLTPDVTTSTSPGDGLRAEILKKWELKLNPDKPNEEEELPCEQQDGNNVLEADDEGGRRSRHHSEVVAGEVVMMLPQTSKYSALGDADNIQKASESERNHVNGGNEEPVAPPPQEWRTLLTTSSDDAGQIQSENTTAFSGEIQPRDDVASRFPDGGLQQSKDLSSPITSLPTPTSTTTPTPFTNSRTCPYPNCGTPFRGPKASEKKHYTCVHTVEHFPGQFLGFSQKDVNELTRGICSQEFSQDRLSKEEVNTFKCPFCAATGIKEADKKFHILEQHKEVVKSRLEARRAVAINAKNHLEEPTNFVDEQQQQQKMLHVTTEQRNQMQMSIVREEVGEHVGQDGGMDEQLEREGHADEMEEEEEEEEEQSDDEMKQGQVEELEEQHDDGHNHDMEVDPLDHEDDGGTQEDEADYWDDSNLEQEEDGPPKLEIPCYTCSYCEIRLYGPHADLIRHKICNHTVAYFTRRGQLPGSTTEEDVDRVILRLRQQGLLSHPDKQDTFRCSFCHKFIVRVDKKYHLLKEHMSLIQSRLKEIEKVTQVVEQAPPPPVSRPFPPPPQLPAVPRTPTPSQLVSIKREAAEGESTPAPPSPPEVEELETTQTDEMLRRHNDKADFYRNREAFKSDPSKPRFNYMFLIKLAIADSPDHQLKARDIFGWIKSSFGYYRRDPQFAKTLKHGITQTLSHNECFVKHKVEGNEGVWRVDFKAFYKAGRKLSRVRAPATSTSRPNAGRLPATVVNVKREVLEGDLSMPQVAPPPGDMMEYSSNQVERAGGSRSKDTMEAKQNHPRRPQTSNTGRGSNCHICNKWCAGPKANLERHLMCIHSTLYFSSQLNPGTSQEELNNAVARLWKENVSYSGNHQKSKFYFSCLLCGASSTYDKRHHFFKEHFTQVLSLVKKSRSTTTTSSSGGVVVPTTANNFDATFASSDLLAHMHIKQERK